MHSLRLGLSVGCREAMFLRVIDAVPVRRLSQSGHALPDPAPSSPVWHSMPWPHGASDQDGWAMQSARVMRPKSESSAT